MKLTKLGLSKIGIRSRSLVDENNVRRPGTARWVGQQPALLDPEDRSMVDPSSKEKWLFLGFDNSEKDGIVYSLKKEGIDIDKSGVLTGNGDLVDGPNTADYKLDLQKSFTYWNKDYWVNTGGVANPKDVDNILQDEINAGRSVIKHDGRLSRVWINPLLHEEEQRKRGITPKNSILTLPINNQTFNAIVWENGIRVGMGVFKPGVWEKFHQILKKDGILYLPLGGYGGIERKKYKNIYGLFNYLGEKTLNLIDTRGRNKTNPRAEWKNTWYAFQKCVRGTYSTVGASSCLLDSETSAQRRWDNLEADAKVKNMWKFRKKDQTHENYIEQIKDGLSDKRKKQVTKKSKVGGKKRKTKRKMHKRKNKTKRLKRKTKRKMHKRKNKTKRLKRKNKTKRQRRKNDITN